MAADPTARAHFIGHIRDFCLDNNLDSVDLDWEPVETAADRDNYSLLLKELSEVLSPLGKRTSVAVAAGSENIHPWVAPYLDWIAVMAYDMGYPHSSMDDATWAMTNWRDTYGFPSEKLVLGVPFYGRNASNTAWTYANIVEAWNPVPAQNWTGKKWDIFFNGRDLVQAKMQYVLDNGYGGVMIWALGYDAPGEASLLAAMDGVNGACAGDINGRLRRRWWRPRNPAWTLGDGPYERGGPQWRWHYQWSRFRSPDSFLGTLFLRTYYGHSAPRHEKDTQVPAIDKARVIEVGGE